jgi:hypothetical protein
MTKMADISVCTELHKMKSINKFIIYKAGSLYSDIALTRQILVLGLRARIV